MAAGAPANTSSDVSGSSSIRHHQSADSSTGPNLEVSGQNCEVRTGRMSPNSKVPYTLPMHPSRSSLSCYSNYYVNIMFRCSIM